MRLKQWFFGHHDIGWLGQFIISVYVAAALNLGHILAQAISTAYARTATEDHFTITECHFGPPVPFVPRLMVLGALFVAAVGVSQRTFPRSLIAVAGLSGAMSVYLYWWADSYRVFKNLADADIDFLNSMEIKQVAYLYQGTSFDVWIALSIFACLVLSLDRLFNSKGSENSPRS